VHLVLAAREELAARGVRARVVSMPSWELFDEQSDEYRRSVLPAGVPRLAVEAGITQGWRKYVGDTGDVIGIDRFGASAPGEVVMREYGFTVENVCRRALALRERKELGS
jgi:transketolase